MLGTQIAKDTSLTNGATMQTAVRLQDAATLDNKGIPFPAPPLTTMEKIDQKASKRIEVSQGTLWFIGTGIVLLGVIFSYGTSMLGFVRDDQSQKMQIQQLQNDVNTLNSSVKEIQMSLEKDREIRQQQEVQNAKALGYQLKAAEGENHGAKK